MNERQMRIRVGLFVLGGLILLGLFSLFFTGFFKAFKSYDEYSIVFDAAPGVAPGTPVRRSGIRIGEVKDVELDPDTGQVRLTVRIEKGHRLRRSDQAIQVRALIGGDPAIDLVARRPDGPPLDQTPLNPGDQIPAGPSGDVRDILAQTQELVPSTQETLNEIRKSVQRFEKMAPQMEEAITEYKELAKAAREVIPEFRRTNDEVQAAARNWGRVGERADVLFQQNQDKIVQALDNLNETVRRVAAAFNEENQRNFSATLKNVRAGTENLESISKNTETFLKQSIVTLDNINRAALPLADRSNAIAKNVDESTEKLNRLLGEISGTGRAGGSGDGSLRRFLTDPALYNNLNEAACMVARMMPRLDRALRDIEVFADKIARHPESLGVGGAIRPSAGLKESPSAGTHVPRH
jgi:phospholipid/cholesterol/gamma-HCH transport system substrate-binding protein